jgi:glutathione-independent formaldehyde dehydrogenase
LIVARRATPSWVAGHELGLDQAVKGHRHFNARDEGWTKVLLHPGKDA